MFSFSIHVLALAQAYARLHKRSFTSIAIMTDNSRLSLLCHESAVPLICVTETLASVS